MSRKMKSLAQIFLTFLLCNISGSCASDCFQPNPLKLDFLCPLTYAETGGFELSINSMKEVTIQCEQLDSFSVRQLPNITISEINLLQFRFCPLPEEGFKEVLDWFETQRTTVIQYEYGDFNQTLAKDSFRGLENLEFLKLNGNNFDGIEWDVFENTPKLIALELKENGLLEVKKFFEGLADLEWLDMTDNQIEDLPEEVFQKLEKLQHLRLWNNKLTKLEEQTFKGLHNLESLDLSANLLETIPEGTFQDLGNLLRLNLATNLLTSLPMNVFRASFKLESVFLNDNYNLTFEDYMFSNFTSLQEVDLSDCGLENIPEHIFQNSLKLKVLSLQNNALKSLPQRLFQNLINLEKIDLSGNQLDSIDFSSMRNLKVLSLRGNNFKTISDGTFAGLVRLEELDLSRNNIYYIHPEAFSTCDGLRIINLSSNMYYGHDVVFKNLVYLEEVDLSHNLVTRVEHIISLDNKPNLKKLDLSRNRIKEVSLFHLQGISNVDINLQDNNITAVDLDNVEELSGPFTSTIRLALNPLDCSCRNYDLVKFFNSPVKVFDIQRDVECASPKALKGRSLDGVPLSALLCDLKSSSCPKECRCSWRPVDTTIVIDCAHRNLTKVPELPTRDFNWIKYSGIEINLANNSLTGGNFSGLSNVTKLLLSHNFLKRISGVPTSLTVLALDHNNLTNLQPQILKSLSSKRLVNLTLGGNPWACDCASEGLATFLLQHSKQVDHRSVVCFNTTTRLVDLRRSDLCYDVYVFIYVLLLCFLLSLVSVVFLLFFHFYKTEIKVWLYSKNLCLWWVSEEDLDKDKTYDAFISYSHKDEEFVVGTLLTELQKAPEEYKLCLAFRDWFPGELISAHIANSVVDSKRTIVVLSENFLGSVWTKAEFQKAHAEAMADGRMRVIAIIYGDLDLEKVEDTELRSYLRTNTYLKWGDPYFWAKLKYAMPHRRGVSP